MTEKEILQLGEKLAEAARALLYKTYTGLGTTPENRALDEALVQWDNMMVDKYLEAIDET